MTVPLDAATALSPTRSVVVEAFIKAIPAIRGSGILKAGDDVVHPFQPMIFLPGITGDHPWKQHP